MIAYITDVTGEKRFKEIFSEENLESVKRDLERHLFNAKKYPHIYHFLDIETAKIII